MSREDYIRRTYGGTKTKTKSSPRTVVSNSGSSSPGQSGSGYSTNVVSDGMTQQQIDQIKNQSKAANEAAYQESLKKQEALRDAIAFMNSQKKDKNNQINVNDIEDQKLEEIAKTGLFAMEASGDLGGTFGAEIEANKLKYALANAQSPKEAEAIRNTLSKLGYSNVSQYDPYTIKGEKNPDYNPNLGFDPTGLLSFGEVESNDDLYDAYKGLQNKNTSASQLRTFLPSVYGYKGSIYPFGGGGGGSSYFGGGTGRDGLGYGVAASGGPQANSYQRGKVAPGTLQEQVNQVYLGMSGLRKARGGIVSLVE